MRKIILFMLTVSLVAPLFTVRAVAEDKTVPTETKMLLMEAETGTVIKENGGYERAPQGTLSKLMTVLLAAEEIESGSLAMDSVLTASKNASEQRGAVIWLTAGENITVEETLKAVIIGNANDASLVIAEELGGSEEEFVGMMNARAFELGMRNTVFESASGFGCSKQYSTAYDTAVLCRELLKHEFLYPIMNTWIDRVRDGQTEIVNENKLVRSYDGIIGLKAAHTEESGYCLAMAAKRGEKSYIAIVMGCGDEDERFLLGKELLSTGFSYYRVTVPSFSGEFMKPVRVKGGVDRAVNITSDSLNKLVVPESAGEISTAVFIPEYLEAPVKKNQKIGRVAFYNEDTLLYETDLITENSVKKMTFKSSINVILYNIYK